MVASRPWQKAITPIIDAIDVHNSFIFFLFVPDFCLVLRDQIGEED